MKCCYCNKRCVKNGLDRKVQQRFKCQDCKKTFTSNTIKNIKDSGKKRLVIHLILAGCEIHLIAEKLNLQEKQIKKWKDSHLKDIKEMLPPKPLLYIETLINVYNSIEKSRNLYFTAKKSQIRK